jgi:hypothetical protein
MKLVIFGLCVTSSWGGGHANLWRRLIGALARHGLSAGRAAAPRRNFIHSPRRFRDERDRSALAR